MTKFVDMPGRRLAAAALGVSAAVAALVFAGGPARAATPWCTTGTTAGGATLSSEAVPADGTERERDLTITTSAMPGGSAKVRLYLPAGYATDPASTTYPVLLLLHGAGAPSDPIEESSYVSWTRRGNVQSLADRYKVVVVMPEGLRYGLYSDWLNASNGFTPKLQTFHLSQVLPLVRSSCRGTSVQAVAGLSAGGFGAYHYAHVNPSPGFRSVAAFSGDMDLLGTRTLLPPFWTRTWIPQGVLANNSQNLNGPWGDPTTSQVSNWRAVNPKDNAATIAGLNIPMFLSYGTANSDPERTLAATDQEMAAALQAAGASPTVRAYSGLAHTWDNFNRGLSEAWSMLMTSISATTVP